MYFFNKAQAIRCRFNPTKLFIWNTDKWGTITNYMNQLLYTVIARIRLLSVVLWKIGRSITVSIFCYI